MRRGIKIFLASVIVAVSAFLVPSFRAFAEDRYEDLQIFAKVLNIIQKYYVDEVDTKKLIQGAIKGMLGELDPHTNYLAPEIFKEFESETSGEFGGIGIEITVQDNILTIISPIEDTPAWEAGIKAGDRIVDIDGTSAKGMTLSEAAQKMKGKKGTAIRLNIMREGFEKPKIFEVRRGVVKVRSAKYTDLGEGYAYVRLTSFIENSAQDLINHVNRHIKANGGKISGLILDLRRNPGGLLDQAVRISDYFLDEGVIVSTIGRNKREKEVIYAKKSNSVGDFPIIVLINEFSASASEIVAGALQDNRRALIMGKQSFGKGSVQSVIKLGDGSGLKITVARYYTPSGVSIQAEGIKPDIIAEEFDQDLLDKALLQRKVRREQDIEGHLVGDREGKAAKEKSDTSYSLAWALQNRTKKGLSSRDQLLSQDYQVLQAFSYIRALSSKKSQVVNAAGAVTSEPAVEGAANTNSTEPGAGTSATPVKNPASPTEVSPNTETIKGTETNKKPVEVESMSSQNPNSKKSSPSKGNKAR